MALPQFQAAPPFEDYVNATDLAAVLAALADGRGTPVAGGTDLWVQKELPGAVTGDRLVNIRNVPQLKGMTEADGRIRIGALVTMTEILEDAHLKDAAPVLPMAADRFASVQIRNAATIGGNIANASPAADSLPVLNVLDAQLWIGPRVNSEFQKRNVEQIMVGPGETTLLNNQYIAYIFIPFPIKENLFWYFRKVGQREALAISKLSLAVLGWYKDGKINDIRISAGAVSAQVKRANKTENVLNDNMLTDEVIAVAKETLEKEINPITDIRSNIEYRKHICGELLRDALYQLKMEKN